MNIARMVRIVATGGLDLLRNWQGDYGVISMASP